MIHFVVGQIEHTRARACEAVALGARGRRANDADNDSCDGATPDIRWHLADARSGGGTTPCIRHTLRGLRRQTHTHTHIQICIASVFGYPACADDGCVVSVDEAVFKSASASLRVAPLLGFMDCGVVAARLRIRKGSR